MIKFYAIFIQEKDGFVTVHFPDVEMAMTQGKDFEEAYDMAIEALAISIGGNPHLKFIPSKKEDLSLEEGGELVPVPVDAQLVAEYSPKKRVNCSFQAKALTMIDQYSKTIGKDRSGLLEAAALEYMQNHPV